MRTLDELLLRIKAKEQKLDVLRSMGISHGVIEFEQTTINELRRQHAKRIIRMVKLMVAEVYVSSKLISGSVTTVSGDINGNCN